MSALPACMLVHCMPSWWLWRTEVGIGAPGTRVVDGCEPFYRGHESNPGLLDLQSYALNH